MQWMRQIAKVSYFVHFQRRYTFNNIMQQYAMQCMRKNSKNNDNIQAPALNTKQIE